ncbi:hypothetical protein AMTRI_Chr13g121340 [Amborella trichopoda]
MLFGEGKRRQSRPTNSRLHSHPCRDGRPTSLKPTSIKPFSYSISLSTDASNPSLSKPHDFKNHSLSLCKTRGPLSLTRAPSFYLPQAHLLLHLSPSTDASTPSLSKPQKNKIHSLSLFKPRGSHENKNQFPLFHKLQEP